MAYFAQHTSPKTTPERISVIASMPRTTTAEPPKDALSAATDSARTASGSVFYGIMNGLEAQLFVPGQRLVEVDLAARCHYGCRLARQAGAKAEAQTKQGESKERRYPGTLH